MNDSLRTLNENGITEFAKFLRSAREGGPQDPPFNLLTDPDYSNGFSDAVQLQARVFPDTYEFGKYLVDVLEPLNRRTIVYDYQLWSWLALYFFDQICPVEHGKRNVLNDASYIVAGTFNHQRYYRHLVRTPWLAVADNQENPKVLLHTKGGGKRSDIFEQIASRQTLFGNPTIVGGAYKLYYDVAAQTPKRGASGKGPGSPRRLGVFVKQIELTYDLRECTPDQFISLLPAEYDRFRNAPKKKSLRKVLADVFSS